MSSESGLRSLHSGGDELLILTETLKPKALYMLLQLTQPGLEVSQPIAARQEC